MHHRIEQSVEPIDLRPLGRHFASYKDESPAGLQSPGDLTGQSQIMGLWPFNGGKTRDVRVEEYVDLDGLEYAFEFAENERAYLKRAWICQDKAVNSRS